MKFETNIVITNTGEHYKTEIIAGSHVLVSDEPVDHDGKDLGPTAHQYLLSALGSCTAITIRMYADRKKWPLEKVVVTLNMEKYVEEGEEKTRIFQKLELEGNLSDEQRERLKIITTKCPVHKTLTQPVTIQSFPQ